MKLVTITFLFFCMCNIGYAKEYSFNFQETDSLLYYYKLANSPKESTDLPKAYKFYLKLKEQNLIKKDTFQAIQNLRQIAIMQNNLGDYYASEASVVEALKLLDKINANDSKAVEARIGLYNQVGRIYRALLKYEPAIAYYDKALLIADTQDKVNIIRNNKALIYNDQKKYNLAEKELLEVYNNIANSGKSTQKARALDNLGLVRSKLNNPIAINNLLEALKIRLSDTDIRGSYSSYKHLSVHFKDRNDNKKALYYANKALRAAKEINAPSYIKDALSHILEFNSDANVIAYKHLQDSFLIAKQIQDNKNALLKYNVAEEKQRTQDSELKKERADKEKLITQGITVLLVLISVFLYFFLKSRHKKENLQQVYNTETRIAKKVHDEVANDVYHVMTKIQQENSENNELLLDDLDDIYNKTRDISREHSIIDLSHDFKVQIDDLLISFKSEATNIITRNLANIDWDKLSEMKKVTIYRVLQELLINMKKHSKATSVIITFKQKAKKLYIDYADNGIGCELKKQNGLINTENRIHSINGTITFETKKNKGFKAKIEI